MMQWTRARSPDALFQLNHPRVRDVPDPGLAYFDHLGVGRAYDPGKPLDAESNRALIEPVEQMIAGLFLWLLFLFLQIRTGALKAEQRQVLGRLFGGPERKLLRVLGFV